MASSLGWLDYDPHERDRTTRILALFRESNARDELGLGSIRDAIAERLFPGTSTIQTRLRYMLFVPWIYKQLEADEVSAADVGSKARKLETLLMEPLLDAREEGVLGRVARGALKRLPSAVYWAGLESWGVRRYGGNRDQYHRAFDRLHTRRRAARRRDDDDVHDARALTWDPGLPDAPDSFPKDASFLLTPSEATYLRDRICERQGASLLAWLVTHTDEVPGTDIWHHPRLEHFPHELHELVQHARVFGELMQGAALLYNLELARLRGDQELQDEHATGLDEWLSLLGQREQAHRAWRPSRFWALTSGHGHSISERARLFVQSWLELALTLDPKQIDAESGRMLVRQRERSLKGVRSRFDNKSALQQWSGAAGLGMPSYRWPTTQVMLADLFAGLQAKEV